MNNVELFEETMSITENGYYYVNNKKVDLKCSLNQLQEAIYISNQEVNDLIQNQTVDKSYPYVIGRMRVEVVNEDSYQAAMNMEDVLVLNFANPFHPGGGVTRGAKAQEEDLCRKSTLYTSLLSSEAAPYYINHNKTQDYLSSDACILSKHVEIIRDWKNQLLEDTKVVSVLTCAAPNLYGSRPLKQEEIESLLMNRIKGILHVAIEYGYKNLVLGAFGCGAFGCNGEMVARCFYEALKNLNINNHTDKDFFHHIVFAVMDHSHSQYNFNAFKETFDDYYIDKNKEAYDRACKQIQENEKQLDAIQGCMIGGAIGDALGYPIEFHSYNQIQITYGTVDHYILSDGKALISDDTQMSLFTANGILFGDTRFHTRGIGSNPSHYVRMAYKDWLHTQDPNYKKNQGISWLLNVKELYSQRAPGNTCLSALYSDRKGSIEHPLNDSKGCGGIMRVAPLVLYYYGKDEEVLDLEGAQIAAITHGHSLGYMPAAALTHILNRILLDKNKKNFDLYKVMKYTTRYMQTLFKKDKYISYMTSLMNKAIELSKNDKTDIENIKELGEGWVAEETLAIAMYCSLRYQNDFDKALIASVNHSGDSDSTGAVTGNIMGALAGYSKISDKWKENLECIDVILEISKDVCDRCQLEEYSPYHDEDWQSKYISGSLYDINQYLMNLK